MRLISFPAFPDNPFTALLTSVPAAWGIERIWPNDVSQLKRVMRWATLDDVLHLQWLHPILAGAESEKDALAEARSFGRWLRRQRANGVTIVWTVHNVLSHEPRWPAVEVLLAETVADSAHAVHIMNPDTPLLAANHFGLPTRKTRVIPHPSYVGWYSPGDGSRPVSGDYLLQFGSVRPYKGLDRVVDVFGRTMAADVGLVVAGPVRAGGSQERVEEVLAPLGQRVAFRPGRVADEEVADLVGGALAVLMLGDAPLNSGTLHLAATFGAPVIVRRSHNLQHLSAEPWVVLVDPDDVKSGLDGAIEDIRASAALRDTAYRFAAARDPLEVSRRFLDLLAEVCPAFCVTGG